MSFWSTVGNVAKTVGKEIVKKTEEARDLSDRWEDKSDSFLDDKKKSGSAVEKMAASRALKNREDD